MKWLLRESLRLLCFVLIFAGATFREPGKNKILGDALLAVGFCAYTVLIFKTDRIWLGADDGPVVGDKSPLTFMFILTVLFFICCFFIGLTIVDIVRQYINS